MTTHSELSRHSRTVRAPPTSTHTAAASQWWSIIQCAWAAHNIEHHGCRPTTRSFEHGSNGRSSTRLSIARLSTDHTFLYAAINSATVPPRSLCLRRCLPTSTKSHVCRSNVHAESRVQCSFPVTIRTAFFTWTAGRTLRTTPAPTTAISSGSGRSTHSIRKSQSGTTILPGSRIFSKPAATAAIHVLSYALWTARPVTARFSRSPWGLSSLLQSERESILRASPVPTA